MRSMDTTADLRSPRAHGSWELVWRRLKHDRVALGSVIALALVVLVCFAGEPIAEHLLGHGPNDIFPMAVDLNLQEAPAWSRVPNTHGVVTVTPHTPRTLFILGASDIVGHDLFLRVLAGGRTSLEIALGAAALAVLIGVALGLVAGYYGRWTTSSWRRCSRRSGSSPSCSRSACSARRCARRSTRGEGSDVAVHREAP